MASAVVLYARTTMHKQPGSPKKPCAVTMTGEHQWFLYRSKVKMCWICGARPLKEEK